MELEKAIEILRAYRIGGYGTLMDIRVMFEAIDTVIAELDTQTECYEEGYRQGYNEGYLAGAMEQIWCGVLEETVYNHFADNGKMAEKIKEDKQWKVIE